MVAFIRASVEAAALLLFIAGVVAISAGLGG
jgi:hypothetical protein